MNLNPKRSRHNDKLSPVSIPIRDLMNLNLITVQFRRQKTDVSIPIRDLMNLNPDWLDIQ